MFSHGTERALRAILDAHDGQIRKGLEQVPYVVHPLHVALMLTRFHSDQEAIQAALLHDVVEDCEEWTVERVADSFGARVASIVEELTEDKSRTWEERKQGAIDGVAGLSEAAVLVKACDKLHNLESLLADLQTAPDPERVWSKFRGGRERTLQMARGLAEALGARVDPLLGDALGRVVDDLERL